MALKVWHAAVIDEQGDYVQYVVATGGKSEARQLLLQRGIRARIGDLTTANPIAEVLKRPAVVFRRGEREREWIEL